MPFPIVHPRSAAIQLATGAPYGGPPVESLLAHGNQISRGVSKHAQVERTITLMSPEVSDLLKRALSLPVDERAALANALLDSLEPAQESIEEAWDKEVARRMKDLEAGRAVTVPWEELRQQLLATLNER
jgi:putative addiction module component (TIGR02574 family)